MPSPPTHDASLGDPAAHQGGGRLPTHLPFPVRLAAVPNHPTRDDIDLCSGAFWAGDHHSVLTWMRQEAPVYFDGAIWGISRYADVKDVSRRTEEFSNAGGIRPSQGPLPQMIDMD